MGSKMMGYSDYLVIWQIIWNLRGPLNAYIYISRVHKACKIFCVRFFLKKRTQNHLTGGVVPDIITAGQLEGRLWHAKVP